MNSLICLYCKRRLYVFRFTDFHERIPPNLLFSKWFSH